MGDSAFSTLIAQIERELGVEIVRSAPLADSSAVPSALAPLYEFSDGLTLPFANIYPGSQVDRRVDPDWLCFGADNYFSFYLCRPESTPAITTWDHESGTEIEAVYGTAIDWLIAEYEAFLDSDTDGDSVVVTSIPNGVPKPALIGALKPLADKPSSAWLELIRSGNFVVPDVNRIQAVNVVRSLHAIGLSCHVDCDS